MKGELALIPLAFIKKNSSKVLILQHSSFELRNVSSFFPRGFSFPFGTFVSTKSKNVDPSVAGQIWPGLFLPFSRSVPPFRSLGRKMLILFGGLANRGSARLARRVGDNTQTKPHMCDNKLSWPVMPSLKS